MRTLSPRVSGMDVGVSITLYDAVHLTVELGACAKLAREMYYKQLNRFWAHSVANRKWCLVVILE